MLGIVSGVLQTMRCSGKKHINNLVVQGFQMRRSLLASTTKHLSTALSNLLLNNLYRVLSATPNIWYLRILQWVRWKQIDVRLRHQTGSREPEAEQKPRSPRSPLNSTRGTR